MPEHLSERARVEAGGLVRVGAKIGDDLATDTVDARGYTTPTLPGRTVVRLVPDAIARGIDTEMSLLGFAMTSHADDIAVQRRRALGFPGATLVIDPDRARYALDVMREFKKHAKRIASKPGHAKEGFDEIGERLSRQVPHFLPSYYEEVARAFAHGGNLTYAGSFFDKARTAEREFGLEVDEERRAEAFLEFALLGALTVKSIQAYGKEVQRLAGADKAYERMLQLATRRTLGGVAPWASLPKDLRSLAKAAKRDLAAEDARFLREVSTAASLKRAPASFWEEYGPAWVALCKADPVVRGRLLGMWPAGGKTRSSWREDKSGFTEAWMALLAESGALEGLWSEVPEAARPNGGRTAWLLQLQEWASAGDGHVLQLVRRAEAALKADGQPVVVSTGGWYKPLDLDLVELCLELGLPWTLEQGSIRVNLQTWAGWKPAPPRYGLAAEHRPKDPVRTARDEKVRPLLRPAIDTVFGDAVFEAVASSMQGLKDLREDWLRERVAELSGPGLPSTEYALGRLEASTTPDHFAEFPAAALALRVADLAASLAGTLRAGLFEEWGWPAWDESDVVLEADKPDAAVASRVQWPWVLRWTNRRLCVLGRDGIVCRLDLRHPEAPLFAWYVGGSVAVSYSYWAKGSSVREAFWSHAPKDTWEPEQRWVRHAESFPIEHADAIVVGTTRFAKGDRAFPEIEAQYSDAEQSWVVVDGELRTQDRQTGKVGAAGSPGFLRAGTTGAEYHPVAHAGALLGVVDGQYGVRREVPREADEDTEAITERALVTLSGERFVGNVIDGNQHLSPAALVRMPGRADVRAVASHARWRSGKYRSSTMMTAPGANKVGTRIDETLGELPPLAAWHHLRPRDERGSAALAALTDAAAAALLAGDGDGVVGGVSHPALAAAVARTVGEGRALRDRLVKLVEARSGGRVRATPAAAQLMDEAVQPLLVNLRHYYSYGNASTSLALETLGRFLRDGETGEAIASSRLDPQGWIGHARAIAVNLARPGLTDEQRAVGVRLVRTFVDAGLAGPSIRSGKLEFSRKDLSWVPLVDDGEGGKKPGAAWRLDEAQYRLFVSDVSETGDDETDGPWSGRFVQRHRGAEVVDPPGAVLSEVRSSDDADPDWLRAFADELAARGAWTVTRAQVERLAEAGGLTPTDAAIVLLGFPTEVDKDQREALGLKHADVKAACQRLRSTPFEEKLVLVAARGGGAPAEVWEESAADRVVAAWGRLHGKKVAVDEAVLLAAEKELGRGAGVVVERIANHGSWAALQVDGTYTLDDSGDPEVSGDAFTPSVASELARAVCWLAGRLPVGDPVRAELPAVVALARARMKNPAAWYVGTRWYHYEDKPKKSAKAWFDALPGRATDVAKNDDDEVTTRRKLVGPVAVTHTDHWTRAAFQLASLDDPSRELLRTLTKLAEREDGATTPFDVLASPGMDAIVARIRSTPVPPGSYEQNPLLSAPDVVKKVAKKQKLSQEAAAAWLQTMALVEPTKKAVCAWNGWSPKVYDDAMAELVAAGLVIEGKRARAGREHYLPGGWVEARMGPPYELWKEASYGGSGGSFPLDRMVPLAPLHELFAAVWARCEQGDAPRFEEVRR
jgi:hypothetical protein